MKAKMATVSGAHTPAPEILYSGQLPPLKTSSASPHIVCFIVSENVISKTAIFTGLNLATSLQ